MTDSIRKQFKGSVAYLHDQRPERSPQGAIQQSLGLTLCQRTAAWGDVSCVLEDRTTGYRAYVGKWEQLPAVIEETGLVAAEGTTGDWRYAIGYPGGGDRAELRRVIPEHRLPQGIYPLFEIEALRVANGEHDQGTRKALEQILVATAEEIESRF